MRVRVETRSVDGCLTHGRALIGKGTSVREGKTGCATEGSVTGVDRNANGVTTRSVGRAEGAECDTSAASVGSVACAGDVMVAGEFGVATDGSVVSTGKGGGSN